MFMFDVFAFENDKSHYTTALFTRPLCPSLAYIDAGSVMSNVPWRAIHLTPYKTVVSIIAGESCGRRIHHATTTLIVFIANLEGAFSFVLLLCFLFLLLQCVGERLLSDPSTTSSTLSVTRFPLDFYPHVFG